MDVLEIRNAVRARPNRDGEDLGRLVLGSCFLALTMQRGLVAASYTTRTYYNDETCSGKVASICVWKVQLEPPMVASEASCVLCGPGTYSSGGNACLPCSHGKSSSVSGATACVSCPSFTTAPSTATARRRKMLVCLHHHHHHRLTTSHAANRKREWWWEWGRGTKSVLAISAISAAHFPIGQQAKFDFGVRYPPHAAPVLWGPLALLTTAATTAASDVLKPPQRPAVDQSIGWEKCNFLACKPSYGPPPVGPSSLSKTIFG